MTHNLLLGSCGNAMERIKQSATSILEWTLNILEIYFLSNLDNQRSMQMNVTSIQTAIHVLLPRKIRSYVDGAWVDSLIIKIEDSLNSNVEVSKVRINAHLHAQKISKLQIAQAGVVTGQLQNAQRVRMENSQMNSLAQQYASQLTGRSVTLAPRNVKDANKEIQVAILMLTAMLHVDFLEQNVTLQLENAIHVIQLKIKNAPKLRALVIKIALK